MLNSVLTYFFKVKKKNSFRQDRRKQLIFQIIKGIQTIYILNCIKISIQMNILNENILLVTIPENRRIYFIRYFITLHYKDFFVTT